MATGESVSELEREFARSASGGRPTTRVRVLRHRGGETTGASDALATEEPLEIRLAGERVAVTMRTPATGEDAELALGFLLGEGILEPSDVARVAACSAGLEDGTAVDVVLRPAARARAGWQRNFYATSSCGICGKASIEAVRVAAPPLGPAPSVAAAVLVGLPGRLREGQRVFARTGGLHAAGLFAPAGELLVLREDVGRHNAVDKVIGRAAMGGGPPLAESILQVSGRASFEIVQKALLAGVAVVSAVSAPSSLAVRLARESGMTLAGFVRDGGFNVYAGEDRIEGLGR